MRTASIRGLFSAKLEADRLTAERLPESCPLGASDIPAATMLLERSVGAPVSIRGEKARDEDVASQPTLEDSSASRSTNPSSGRCGS